MQLPDLEPVSQPLSIVAISFTYHWNRKENNDDVSDNIRDGECIMQYHSVAARCQFDQRTGPIGRKVCFTDKKNGEEEADCPGSDDYDHEASDPMKFNSRLFCENSPVQEDEAKFHETQRRNLDELNRPECLLRLVKCHVESGKLIPRPHPAVLPQEQELHSQVCEDPPLSISD